MNKIYLSLLTLALSTAAHAAELEVASCNTDIGAGGQRATLKLVVDDTGRLVAKTGPFGGLLETSKDLKVDAVEPVSDEFLGAFARANQRRDTGIRPGDIRQVQHVFLSGNVDFHTDLFKLIGAGGRTLGWAASTIIISGCYAN